MDRGGRFGVQHLINRSYIGTRRIVTPPILPDAVYRSLFQAIDAGFFIVEIIVEDERPVDYRIVDANAAFERRTGLAEPRGRLASELVPLPEQRWIDLYARVATTGDPMHVESQSDRMGRWFDVHAFRVGDPAARQVAVLFADITARRHADHALADSEERLQQALSAGGGVGTWDWNIRTDSVTADARFARLYGVDPDMARAGAPIGAFFAGIHPDDLPGAEAAVAAAVASGGEFSQEYRLVQPDGSSRWVHAQGRCIQGVDGRAERFPGVSFDISDRKRAERGQAALLDLADRLRDQNDPAMIPYIGSEVLGRALDVSRVGYGVIDPAAETITVERDWNGPGITSLAGVLRFRDYGSYIEDLKAGTTVVIDDVRLDPSTATGAPELEAISARSFVNMPLVEQGGFVALFYVNHAAARHWYPDELSLMREVAERVRGATERARAEQARRESEEQFRVFAQALPNQVWAARPDGSLYWFNQQVFAYGSQRIEDLQGVEGWTRVIHPDDYAMVAPAWAHSLATGDIYEVEFRIRRADGAYRWFLGFAASVKHRVATHVRPSPCAAFFLLRCTKGLRCRHDGFCTDLEHDEPRRACRDPGADGRRDGPRDASRCSRIRRQLRGLGNGRRRLPRGRRQGQSRQGDGDGAGMPRRPDRRLPTGPRCRGDPCGRRSRRRGDRPQHGMPGPQGRRRARRFGPDA